MFYLRLRGMAYRVFKSPDGAVWHAWDVPAADASLAPVLAGRPDAMREGWLCFECDQEKRRLAPVPARWAERSEAELWLYCRVAEPAPHGSSSCRPEGLAAAQTAPAAEVRTETLKPGA
jgi:hypothetical protein